MSAPRSPRRRGREVALQVLCALDKQPDLGVEQAFGLYYRALAQDPGDPEDVAPEEDADARRFAEGLVRGAWSQRQAIDDLLSQCSRKWRLSRMSWVDRNVLRLCAHELRERSADVPARVAVNEAIELARRFGTTESASFVNGVLDSVIEALGRRQEPAPAAAPDPARG